MNENLYEALEVSLKALETGAAPESVLELFPEMKDDLLPLLDASYRAKLLAKSEVPEAVLRRGKVRVLQHAAQMRKVDTKSHRRSAIFIFPRLAASLVIALLFLLSGTGLVRASGAALPGDNLYPVKRTWEDMRLLLVFNPDSREELESEFEQERLHEVDELLAEGRHETIAFKGIVTEQSSDLWVVSGVSVQITADSRLPAIPVTVGMSVMLRGRTNAQGYVEVERLDIINPNIVLPLREPTPIETIEDSSNQGSSGLEIDGNEHEDESELESSSGENQDIDGDDFEEEDSDSNNSDKDENDSDNEDRKDESNDTKDQSDDNMGENNNSGGGPDGPNENNYEGQD